jgi:hypothetical protein
LQCREPDYQKAKYFYRQALEHKSWLRFSKERMRIALAIAIMQWFGADGYQKFIYVLYGLRRGLKFSSN